MAAARKLNFTAISTSLLLSIVALPVSVIAFCVGHLPDIPVWSVFWMFLVLPVIWAFVVAFDIRDALKHHLWRQIGGSILLLAPTVLLAGFMLTPPFRLYRDPGPHFPAEGWVTVERFSSCPEETNCTA